MRSVVEGLCSISGRGACTDAERRAALWLHDELRSRGHEAWVETRWVRPQRYATLALGALLGVAGSLLATAAPAAGLAGAVGSAASRRPGSERCSSSPRSCSWWPSRRRSTSRCPASRRAPTTTPPASRWRSRCSTSCAASPRACWRRRSCSPAPAMPSRPRPPATCCSSWGRAAPTARSGRRATRGLRAAAGRAGQTLGHAEGGRRSRGVGIACVDERGITARAHQADDTVVETGVMEATLDLALGTVDALDAELSAAARVASRPA